MKRDLESRAKRFLSVILSAIISVSLFSFPALGAEEELFPTLRQYEGFSDVGEDDWFAPYVKLCYETGLMSGTGEGQFSPGGSVTQAEAVTLALRIHQIRHGGDGVLPQAPEEWGRLTLAFEDGEVWQGYHGSENGWYLTGRTGSTLYFSRPQGWAGKDYQKATLDLGGEAQYRGSTHFPGPSDQFLTFYPEEPESGDAEHSYYDLLHAQSYRPGPDKWWRGAAYYQETVGLKEVYALSPSGSPADRGDFVAALAAVSEGLLEPINDITDYPDREGTLETNVVLPFYRAGILTGVDEYGTFGSALGLSRAEMAAMAARLVRPELRVEFSPRGPEYASYTLTELPVPEGLSVSEGWDPTPDRLPLKWEGSIRGIADVLLQADGSLFELPEGISIQQWPSPLQDEMPLAVVTVDDPSVWESTGVMDLDTGEFVLPLGRYDCCLFLADGYFLTRENNRYLDPAEPYLLRDRTGAVVAPLYGIADWLSLDCGTGLAPCYDREAGLWGYVDLSGQWAIPPQFGSYGHFCDGYVANTLERDGQWYGGVMDAQGNEVLPFQYATSLEYRGDGLFRAGSYWVDLEGKKTVNGFSAYDIYCSHGYFALRNRYLDREFRDATPKEFDWTGPIGKDGSGFVGKDGKIYRIQFQ